MTNLAVTIKIVVVVNSLICRKLVGNLNLGLESLNRVNSAVVPFTPASAIEMQNASEAITNLMSSLENYYDASRNAMLVKKAVKKYGKTQSIVALIGQEGLAAAQSFSMEGFWEKVKNFLIAIWEKIKEWWGRFWGMFFSVENKLNSFISSLNGNKRLAHEVEFDSADYKLVADHAKTVKDSVQAISDAAKNISDKTALERIKKLVGEYDATQNGGTVAINKAWKQIHYKLGTLNEVKAIAKAMYDVIKQFKDTKSKIDEYTKKILDKVKTMKVDVKAGSGADIFDRNGTAVDRKEANSEEQDIATKIVKSAAKLNNEKVADVVKAASQISIKLMAHTRLTD